MFNVKLSAFHFIGVSCQFLLSENLATYAHGNVLLSPPKLLIGWGLFNIFLWCFMSYDNDVNDLRKFVLFVNQVTYNSAIYRFIDIRIHCGSNRTLSFSTSRNRTKKWITFVCMWLWLSVCHPGRKRYENIVAKWYVMMSVSAYDGLIKVLSSKMEVFCFTLFLSPNSTREF